MDYSILNMRALTTFIIIRFLGFTTFVKSESNMKVYDMSGSSAKIWLMLLKLYKMRHQLVKFNKFRLCYTCANYAKSNLITACDRVVLEHKLKLLIVR
ncbi:hypothetical protein H5410_021159 [Solanum commersonii]|uniref:Uncharacterized protein n=1 Tax=Solanum commersonii TaxID=4109 RepID=A0A9J5ZGC4_SOLCO|nr:hypothetical protein H5410_021159 [Solanum commersonii]